MAVTFACFAGGPQAPELKLLSQLPADMQQQGVGIV